MIPGITIFRISKNKHLDLHLATTQVISMQKRTALDQEVINYESIRATSEISYSVHPEIAPNSTFQEKCEPFTEKAQRSGAGQSIHGMEDYGKSIINASCSNPINIEEIPTHSECVP